MKEERITLPHVISMEPDLITEKVAMIKKLNARHLCFIHKWVKTLFNFLLAPFLLGAVGNRDPWICLILDWVMPLECGAYSSLLLVLYGIWHRLVLWCLFISWVRTPTPVPLLGRQPRPDQEYSVLHKLQGLSNLSHFKTGLHWARQIL